MNFSAEIYLLLAVVLVLISCDKSDEQDDSTNKEKLEQIGLLPTAINESSGLILLGDVLLTHNDRGSLPFLYVLDTSNAQLINTVQASTIFYEDWEELTQSDEQIFIGDFGNNDGDRNNLKILIINKNSFNPTTSSTVPVDGIIEFNYPEQTSFTPSNNHNFDCEAFFFFNNYLYLFTKNRGNTKTYLYKLPAVAGQYEAERIDSFNVGALVTAADINKEGNSICLTAYNKSGNCYLLFFDNFSEDNFFSGAFRKYTLGTFANIGQVEAVAFNSSNEVFISTERIPTSHQRLYRFRR